MLKPEQINLLDKNSWKESDLEIIKAGYDIDSMVNEGSMVGVTRMTFVYLKYQMIWIIEILNLL